MTFLKLTFRSLFYYWRSHALILSGAILAAAVLVGALLVGDSIKFSLQQSALLRLGNIQWALESRGRFFPADLAARLQAETGAIVSPALFFRGIALSTKDSGTEPRQINNIQILGVADSFWSFTTAPKPTLTPDGIAINEKLANELQLRRGDQLSIRFSKPSLMSRDAPLSAQEKNDTLRATFMVEDIVGDKQLGRFNLAANQQIPFTVFVSLPSLQQSAGVNHQANLLLACESTNQTVELLNQAICKVWQLADAGLTLRTVDGGRLFQLECDRIFMDPPIGTALADMTKSVGALTYLVNSISRTNGNPLRETPYSFIVALAPSTDPALGQVSPDMPDDGIIINRWLADQLAASPGDAVKLTYFEFGALNKFIETNRIFKIQRIATMDTFAGEKELGPKFPGLIDAGKCAEWDVGMPMQRDKLEDPANEAYWNAYRTTPKAIVTLKAGQEMWANRFGNLTAIRFRANEDGAEAITETVLQHLNPAQLGLTFLPIRQTALKAASEAMDFGQLFFGMSLFLIVASLMLTALLVALGIQQRSAETGLMLSVGFQPCQIRRLWIQECVLITLAGSVIGTLFGTFYTQTLIWGLCHYWQGAVARAEIQYHATFSTMATGALLSFVFAMGSLLLMIKRQTSKSAHELLSGEITPLQKPTTTLSGRSQWFVLRFMPVLWPFTGLTMALGLIGYASIVPIHNPATIFFGAGSLLLISLLGFARLLLVRLARPGGRLTPLTLGLRNAGRQQSRSLTVASLLACGYFLVIAVSSMQENIEHGASRRDSGTGGFTLFGYSTLPIQAALNTPEGLQRMQLDPALKMNVTNIVSMKVRDGDDASCLNLNHAQSPTLIGIDPDDFRKRGAFETPTMSPGIWRLLDESLPGEVIPGSVGDANTAQWGLKSKIGKENGDVLVFRNERGEPFRVKLVGTLPMRLSVFQGSILIPAHAFAVQYPSENGARMFLIDTPLDSGRSIKNALTLKLGKWGANFTSTTERLRSFYSVEATYMAMFLVLGGLGLLLGSAGMTVVILRNIQERRNELALLTATGYSERQVINVVLAEHGVILGIGLITGITASLAAIWPAFQTAGDGLHWMALSVLICGMLLFQAIWLLLATRIAIRAPLFNALRNQ